MSTDRLPRPRHQDRAKSGAWRCPGPKWAETRTPNARGSESGGRHTACACYTDAERTSIGDPRTAQGVCLLRGRRTHEDRRPRYGGNFRSEAGIPEIEGEFPRRADGARDRTDERPENSVDVEPPRLQVTARIGTAFPATPLLGFRGGRSGRTAMTSGCIRADTPVVGWEVPADRRRYGGPNWRGRFRCLAAARGPVSSGVRH